MQIKLSVRQARVIGVLLEKEITTPDQYPLSLNGLTLGCNQKSSREPVMSLSESEVQTVLEELREKKLTYQQSGSTSRVVKYRHRFCNTEFSDLQFSLQQKAIVCLLLLRGPQTPGELRTRSNRLAEFSNVDDVELALEQMKNLNGQQLVIQLPREPGKRDCRYAHLLGDQEPLQSTLAIAEDIDAGEHITHSNVQQDKMYERMAALEQQVGDLSQQLTELRELIEILSE
ncbi:MAG: hypothetical protein ACI965_001637 [Paraglaciecola sp.]|jgi:uncharacterized protein YceH (UPF0502 family)